MYKYILPYVNMYIHIHKYIIYYIYKYMHIYSNHSVKYALWTQGRSAYLGLFTHRMFSPNFVLSAHFRERGPNSHRSNPVCFLIDHAQLHRILFIHLISSQHTICAPIVFSGYVDFLCISRFSKTEGLGNSKIIGCGRVCDACVLFLLLNQISYSDEVHKLWVP